MKSLYSVWLALHLIGLALGVGAATVKVVLLLRCKTDHRFVSVYLQVMRPITRLLVTGLILLTLSGIGWLISPGGYSFTPILIAKLALVLALWAVGPVIDNVLEPRFRQLAPAPDATPGADYLAARDRLVNVELAATGLFYAITLMGVALY